MPGQSRRRFLGGIGALAAATMTPSGARLAAADERAAGEAAAGFGPLLPDPEGLLDLPDGFRYRVVSRAGDPMEDGFLVPGLPDGMHAFAGPDGRTVLVRNHELDPGSPETAFRHLNRALTQEELARIYDAGAGRGGTTTVVYDTVAGRVERQFLSLAGTLRNCSGGATPWGSWISCEEIVIGTGEHGAQRDHGYNFEVPSTARGLVTPVPLVDMGRFYHEAVAVDGRTGVIYQSEDLADGLFYRFLPRQPGRLAAGGRLQALVLRDLPGVDTSNHWHRRTRVPPGQRHPVGWVDLTDPRSPADDLRLRGRAKGAAVFSRGEGMTVERDAASDETRIWLVCTTGGRRGLGQLWCYRPSVEEGRAGEHAKPGTLELYLEPDNSDLLNHGDNITVAPFGDLVICEDNRRTQHLVGVTADGGLYRLAANARGNSELAGATFSPDASTLFVNIQKPGLTLAITGPWETRRS